MKKALVLFASLLTALFAQETMSEEKIAALVKKGEKIAKTLCQSDKLPQSSAAIEELKKEIQSSNACAGISGSNLEAVAYYLHRGAQQKGGAALHVPTGAKCPVCGMFVSKYPKWAAVMEISGKAYYFDGVKDMMKYYIFDGDFPYERDAIEQMKVTDYYTLEAINAKEAFYVIGSDIYGPMGNELIPFASEKSAKNFLNEHKGEKIVRFDAITGEMVMALDSLDHPQ